MGEDHTGAWIVKVQNYGGHLEAANHTYCPAPFFFPHNSWSIHTEWLFLFRCILFHVGAPWFIYVGLCWDLLSGFLIFCCYSQGCNDCFCTGIISSISGGVIPGDKMAKSKGVVLCKCSHKNFLYLWDWEMESLSPPINPSGLFFKWISTNLAAYQTLIYLLIYLFLVEG